MYPATPINGLNSLTLQAMETVTESNWAMESKELLQAPDGNDFFIDYAYASLCYGDGWQHCFHTR